jgi:hypothetical protein
MQDARYWAKAADRHAQVSELLEAADAVWTDAAEGGANEVGLVSGHNIRRLALAVCALRGLPVEAEEWDLARQWPEADA